MVPYIAHSVVVVWLLSLIDISLSFDEEDYGPVEAEVFFRARGAAPIL